MIKLDIITGEEKEFDKLINSLTQEDSEYRKKIAKDWALHADEELAVAIGKLPASRHIKITGEVI